MRSTGGGSGQGGATGLSTWVASSEVDEPAVVAEGAAGGGEVDLRVDDVDAGTSVEREVGPRVDGDVLAALLVLVGEVSGRIGA